MQRDLLCRGVVPSPTATACTCPLPRRLRAPGAHAGAWAAQRERGSSCPVHLLCRRSSILQQHFRGVVPVTHAHLQLHMLPRQALDHRRHLLRVPHARQPPQLGGNINTRRLCALRLAPCWRLPHGGLGQEHLTGREDVIRHRRTRLAHPLWLGCPASLLPRRCRLLLPLLCRRWWWRRRLRCAGRRQLLQSDTRLQLASQVTLGQRQGQRQVRAFHIPGCKARRGAHATQLGDTPGEVRPSPLLLSPRHRRRRKATWSSNCLHACCVMRHPRLVHRRNSPTSGRVSCSSLGSGSARTHCRRCLRQC